MGRKAENLVGQTFGEWAVLSRLDKGNTTYYICMCSCGTERALSEHSLKHRKNLHCGCKFKKKNPQAPQPVELCCQSQINTDPPTDETRLIACYMHYNGYTTEKTAEAMNRPEEMIKQILRECILDGTYAKYNYYMNDKNRVDRTLEGLRHALENQTPAPNAKRRRKK